MTIYRNFGLPGKSDLTSAEKKALRESNAGWKRSGKNNGEPFNVKVEGTADSWAETDGEGSHTLYRDGKVLPRALHPKTQDFS